MNLFKNIVIIHNLKEPLDVCVYVVGHIIRIFKKITEKKKELYHYNPKNSCKVKGDNNIILNDQSDIIL